MKATAVARRSRAAGVRLAACSAAFAAGTALLVAACGSAGLGQAPLSPPATGRATTAVPTTAVPTTTVPTTAVPTTTVPTTAVPTTTVPTTGVSGAGLGTVKARRAAAARYLAIARPANARLDHDFDGYEDDSGSDLAGAEADLRAAATTERTFDRQLLQLRLSPAVEEIARLMVTANQSRARLTDAAARSTSLAELRLYRPRLTAANEPVEEAVRVLRSQLGLPPPETS